MRHNFKRYCKEPEKIENYDKAKADNFIGWNCHHRLETHNSDGERRAANITVAELKSLNMYYNRPASELIFLTESEHTTLHTKGKQGYWKGKTGPNKGKKLSEEHKKKIGVAHNGKHHSEETKKKLRDAHKGKKHTEETKNKISKVKIGNTATKDTHWYNNGKINIMAKECPDGFVPGRLI